MADYSLILVTNRYMTDGCWAQQTHKKRWVLPGTSAIQENGRAHKNFKGQPIIIKHVGTYRRHSHGWMWDVQTGSLVKVDMLQKKDYIILHQPDNPIFTVFIGQARRARMQWTRLRKHWNSAHMYNAKGPLTKALYTSQPSICQRNDSLAEQIKRPL